MVIKIRIQFVNQMYNVLIKLSLRVYGKRFESITNFGYPVKCCVFPKV